MPFKTFSRPRFRQMLGHERGKPLGSATAEPSPSIAPEPMAPDMHVPESSSGRGKLEPFDAPKDNSSVFVSKVVPETSPLLFDRDFQATSATRGIIDSYCSEGNGVDRDTESNSSSEFTLALMQFEQNYKLFVKHQYQSRLVVIGEEIETAFQSAETDKRIAVSAQIFSRRLTTVLGSLKAQKEGRNQIWTGNLVNFVQKIYPIARIALEVTSSLSQATVFSMPLQVMVDGLGIILQVFTFGVVTYGKVIDGELKKADEFLQRLTRVQNQAERISDSPNVDLTSKPIRERIQKRSTILMTAIIRFFDSTLLYFQQSFFGKRR